MKKLIILIVCAISLNSCATLFGGPVSQYQKTRPLPGEPQRQVRVVALVADLVLFWPSLIVDFATGAIYKPAPKGGVTPAKNTKKEEKMF